MAGKLLIWEIEQNYINWLRAHDLDSLDERMRLLRLFTGEFADTHAYLLDTLHFDLHVKTCLKVGFDRERIIQELLEIHKMLSRAVEEGWIEARSYSPYMVSFLVNA